MKSVIIMISLFLFQYIGIDAQEFQTVLGPLKISDSAKYNYNYMPDILGLDNDKFLAVWCNADKMPDNDYEGNVEIVIQKINIDGSKYLINPLKLANKDYFYDSYNLEYPSLFSGIKDSSVMVYWSEIGEFTVAGGLHIDNNLNSISDIIKVGTGGGFCDIKSQTNNSSTIVIWDSWIHHSYEARYNYIENGTSTGNQKYISALTDEYLRTSYASGILNDETLIICEMPDSPPPTVYCGIYDINSKNFINSFSAFNDSNHRLDELQIITGNTNEFYIVWSERNNSNTLISSIKINQYNEDGLLLKSAVLNDVSAMQSDRSSLQYKPSRFQVFLAENGAILLIYQTDQLVNCKVLGPELTEINSYTLLELSEAKEENFNYSLNKDNLFIVWNNNTGTEIWVKVVKLDEIVEEENEVSKMTSEFKLYQNYPNPFNPSTVIRFSLPKAETATLKVYDVLGREVAVLVNEFKQAGTYSVEFNGSELSSGVYIYQITAGNYSETSKMVLSK